MELARRASAGETAAADELLRELEPLVVRTVRLIIGSGSWVAEDAAQDALLDIDRGIHSLRDPQAVKAWALRVAAQRALKVARRERLLSLRRVPDLDPELVAESSEPEVGRSAAIKAAFDLLPARLRATAVLRLYAGTETRLSSANVATGAVMYTGLGTKFRPPFGSWPPELIRARRGSFSVRPRPAASFAAVKHSGRGIACSDPMTDFRLLSDAELIAASATDVDAFRELYDRYAERLYRFFVRRGVSVDGAVDLVAEVFAEAWASRRRFRNLAGGSAGPWLFVIGRRVLLASARRGVIERRALERLRVEWQDSHEIVDSSALEGLDAELELALAELPVVQRRALELRVFGGLAYAAIARELGCTSTAARIRVSRGLARLRTQLEGNG